MKRTAEEIITFIEERIKGCDFAESLATRDFLNAESEGQRTNAVNMSQIATGQRNVLQWVLDEATGDEAGDPD